MIKIICVGKIKEKYLKEAIEEYKKRLSKYTKLEIIEVQDEGIDEEKKAMSIEKDRIQKHLKPTDYIVTLEIEGTEMTSVDFSKRIDSIFNMNSTICFIIGGSYGLDEEIKKISNFSLSFSKMTFPHQLFRVFLLEQIYRSYKINNNEKYHK